MNRRVLLAGACAFGVAFPARTQGQKLVEAISGDHFRMDGVDYLLTDIQAPSRYLLGQDHAPFFTEARKVMADLLAGGDISIEGSGDVTRWRERRVNARLGGDTLSLQEHLVRAGAARVTPYTDDHDFIRTLLVAEDIARNARRGLWGESFYRVLDAQNAQGGIGAFQLVEGVVREASEVKSRVYLNFGEDFRTDFTATTLPRLARRWAKQGLDLLSLSGSYLRVRGFLLEINGPSIELTHPLQVEMLAGP